MKEKISEIKNKAIENIKNSIDLKALDDIRVKILGKKGELTALLKGMKDLANEEKPVIGSLVNEAKDM